MKAYGQITLTVVNDGEQGKPGTPALNVVVANESQSIPCTNAGLVSKQMLLEIPFTGYEGFTKLRVRLQLVNCHPEYLIPLKMQPLRRTEKLF